MQSRAEHLAWCKRRALEYLDAGDGDQAITSMMSDLNKHPETEISRKGGALSMLALWHYGKIAGRDSQIHRGVQLMASEPKHLWVNGIVAVRDNQPYIQLSNENGMLAQLSMSDARQFAGRHHPDVRPAPRPTPCSCGFSGKWNFRRERRRPS